MKKAIFILLLFPVFSQAQTKKDTVAAKKLITPVQSIDTIRYALVMTAQQAQIQFTVNEIAKQSIPYLPETVMSDRDKVTALKAIDANTAFLRQSIRPVVSDTITKPSVKPVPSKAPKKAKQ